jgi:UDP-2,4-diacetamido-2,4,6-trideoxy-beta-L-altropyranose hydrolase
MRVAFRVDASTAIGTGHVRRCLALAAALRALGAETRFVCRDLGVATDGYLRAEGFAGTLLPAARAHDRPDDDASIAHAAWAGVGAATDAEQTIAALRAEPPDWVVIDHYSFGARWHSRVREALGCRVAAIDDLGDRALAVDVLVDHNVSSDHRLKYAGRLERAAAMLVGPGYALLAPAYADAPRCVVGREVRSIGIFMGGIDRGDYSSMALQACREHAGFEGDVEVASTRSNPQLAALERAVTRWPRTRLALDLPDLAAFFTRHDLQIGAAGGATWERCCIGAPALVMAVADNQRHVLEPLSRLGVVWPLAGTPSGTADVVPALRTLIGDPALRRRLADAARRLVDGRGAARVAEHLLQA